MSSEDEVEGTLDYVRIEQNRTEWTDIRPLYRAVVEGSENDRTCWTGMKMTTILTLILLSKRCLYGDEDGLLSSILPTQWLFKLVVPLKQNGTRLKRVER